MKQNEERAKMEKLKFGDKQSINLRDRAEEENLIKELLTKVKCPLCGAKANAAWSIDIKEGYIGWNFDCKPECHNSVEWCQEHCLYDMDGCFTNLKGKYEEGGIK